MKVSFTWYSNWKRYEYLTSQCEWRGDVTDAQKVTWPSVDLEVEVNEESQHSVLEHIFRACNRVDGSEVEIVPDGMPSMSAGDLVEIGDDVFFCAPFGWKHVTDKAALEAFKRLPPTEAHYKAPAYDEAGNLSIKAAI